MAERPPTRTRLDVSIADDTRPVAEITRVVVFAAASGGGGREQSKGELRPGFTGRRKAVDRSTPGYDRDFADRDVYRIERDRKTDPRWPVPDRPVEAASTS